MSTAETPPGLINTPRQVFFASLVGTTVEFFDFYILRHGGGARVPAAVLSTSGPHRRDAGLPGHFRRRVSRAPRRCPALRALRRPRRTQGDAGPGALVHGPVHVPDRHLAGVRHARGRRAGAARALPFRPGHRPGRRVGRGRVARRRERPAGSACFYGMFPQLGAPIGFLLSGGTFLLLSRWLSEAQFFAFGWRLPFLASAVLVLLGL